MKKDNRMMLVVILLSVLSFFLFSQDAEEKLSAGGFILLSALAVGSQGYLFIRKRPWPDRRFGLLCAGMGIWAALLIGYACRVKSHMGEYGDLLIAEGWAVAAAVLVWCGLCLWAEKRVTENTVLLILFGGFLMRLFYVVLVQSHILQNDTGALLAGDYGHMGYVYHIFSEGRLPDVYSVQFYHPPLHHAVCALLLKIFSALGYEIEEMQELLQVQALMYGTLTLFFVNKIGIRLRISPLGRAIGLAFASFLPYGIMMGGAVNNDSLMVLFAVMALYYTLVWYEEPSYKNILIMALCIGCSMMAKLSGALVAPAMAVLMLHKAWKERKRLGEWLKQFVCFGAVAFPLGLWYSVFRNVKNGMPFGYVPSLREDDAQFIGMHTGWSRLLDFKNAFGSAALRWNNEEWADYNIPVSMIKCAILGEGYAYDTNAALYGLAWAMFWATLVLAVLAAAGCILWLFQKRQRPVEKLFICTAFGVSLISYFRFCLDYPFVCTMNIRYIMVTVYLAFLLLGGAMETLTENIGKRSAAAARGMKAAAGILAGCYMAGAVALIVQAGQVLP